MTNRRPRATKEQMLQRRETVLSALEVEPKSIYDLAELVSLTYPQAVAMLRSLEDEGVIQRVGRENRKLIYKLGSERIVASRVDNELYTVMEINGEVFVKLSDIINEIPEGILEPLDALLDNEQDTDFNM